MATHFVLDQSFPALPDVRWPPSIRITHVHEYDARLTGDIEDWQVMLSLHQRGDVDVFVTQDRHILDSPTEMVVLARIGLALVVASDTGDNPLRAAGLLLAGAENVARLIANEGPSVYWLSTRPVRMSPDDLVHAIAARQGLSPQYLTRREMARVGDLSGPVVPWRND